MDIHAPDQDARANHEWLLGEFLQLLFRQSPESVLDVGCGAGGLLKACRAEGVRALGIDQPGPRLDELRAAGETVSEGSAYALPFGEGEVEWVTLRHIPHHLEDPARAFAEAMRVASVGVLLAEPSFDSSIASQRGALALDVWEKRLDREGGMVHGEVLDLKQLLDALPEGWQRGWEFESWNCLRLRERSIPFFEGRSELRLQSLERDHPERARLADLLETLRELGLSWNGSLCLLLRRS